MALLNRPEKRNALTPDMLANIVSSLEMVRQETRRTGAVVLAGEGPVFCAGFDLSLCRDDQNMTASLLARLSGAVRSLRRMARPVVVAAHGAAIAGGCALLSGGDVVVTDRHAKLGYPVVKLGVSPAVTAPALGGAVQDSAVRRLLLDPRLIRGEEAVRIGLAHELVNEPADVRSRAIEIASALACKPAHAMGVTKRWLNEIEGVDRDDRFDSALAASVALAGGAEECERLQSLWKKDGP